VIDRRAFLGTLTGGLLAAPLGAEAQPAGKVWRIGVLAYSALPPDPVEAEAQNSSVHAFMRGLRDLGNADGKHFTIEIRSAKGRRERYPDLIAELIRHQVDIIVAVVLRCQRSKRQPRRSPLLWRAPWIRWPPGS
jgi:putative ABC transport system substrate-binding protein